MIELLQQLIDFVLHIDKHLVELTQQYHGWVYLIVFLIVFCETGLIVTPFLPGDSLLFALGALAALPESGLHIVLILVLMCVAAILGDSVNYLFGRKLGDQVYQRNYWFLKREYLDEAQLFYNRYGGRTIVYARFIPIVRTFAPFVAGIGKMHYRNFVVYNVLGALVWVFLFCLAGYFLGNIPVVKENFSLLVIGIIVISIMPPIIALLKKKTSSKA
ncbi:DedA family protein [Pontibacter liquoris]|uniref:DedA family protein n=1 Tax=Pontibacter liquoris TaxID=2905677 RepID=UPI002103B2FA|nr:DedA family protein [Pontibacter liquoris]